MQTIWLILQITLSVLLIAAILLQAQGSGLGSTWGGGGETYHTKRGVEKVIFKATIALVVCFSLVSIAVLIGR
jgi:protein translocase SecG subunit